MSNVRQISEHRTRKLTGVAPWPIILLAGAEKTGKTWQAVEACMSPIVAGGLWFPLGENDPDEYKQIPGFKDERFDLVEHDGSYRGLLGEMLWHLEQEKTRKGPPLVWVLDSSTRLWDLLSGMAQREMYERLARKAAQQNRPAPDIEQKPSMDLWNLAAQRWEHVIDALRAHRGPVVITARMELKTVMNDKGEPTRDKEQKIQAQKSLPFDVDAIVEMPALGEAYLTGVRSVKLAGLDPKVKLPKFTVHELWTRMGVDQAGARSHATIDVEDKPAQAADAARHDLGALCAEQGWDTKVIAAEFAAANDGIEVKVASEALIREFIAAKTPKKASA